MSSKPNPLEELVERLVTDQALVLAQMQTDVAATRNAVTLRGAEPRPLPATSSKVSSSPGRLVGYSLRETAGAVATVRLRDGDASGDIVATLALAANASSTIWMGGGVSLTYGLFVELVAGTCEGSLYLGAAD